MTDNCQHFPVYLSLLQAASAPLSRSDNIHNLVNHAILHYMNPFNFHMDMPLGKCDDKPLGRSLFIIFIFYEFQ